MAFAIGKSNPNFLPDALSASKVGVWEWEVVGDRMRVDATCAALFGLPVRQAEQGLPLQAASDAIHPDDYPLFQRQITDVLARGGLFVAEYRTCPSPSDTRWILARGRFEVGENGLVIHGRGIVIDITESKKEGHVEEGAVFLTMQSEGELSPLIRATDKAISTYQELEQMGAEGGRLRAVARPLLIALGHELVRSTGAQEAKGEPQPKPMH
ncbi:PAS domain-containing protein [Pararoseomonas indoligenes]|uniref:histidine kinase n=1 Tax=Roseomonas indoligenes TaxID=2820811 RepID=A0A940MZ79_9PROT|nr:PAS domain-containing protein [Pararoseomonas indoligenes]MBP0494886.1 PAS domain-containing protein [Pararoseomonas indoligenes]